MSKLLSRPRKKPASPPPPFTSMQTTPADEEPVPDVHPSLLEYISMPPVDYSNTNSQSPTSFSSSSAFPHPHSQCPPASSEYRNLSIPWEPLPPNPTFQGDQRFAVPAGNLDQYGNFNTEHGWPENLEMVMAADSGMEMDGELMAFLRDSGLLEASTNQNQYNDGSV